jgi:hypothetical protein
VCTNEGCAGGESNANASVMEINQALICINEGYAHKQGESDAVKTDGEKVSLWALTCTNEGNH